MAANEQQILSYIRGLESNDNYNAYYGNAGNQSIDFTDMTIQEVLDWQRAFVSNGSPSSVVGAYQFRRDNLRGLAVKLGIPLDSKFTPEIQDAMAAELLRRRGLRKWEDGLLTTKAFGNNLAQEWAALPVLSGNGAGFSYYEGDNLNHALDSAENFESLLKGASGHPVPPGSIPGRLGDRAQAMFSYFGVNSPVERNDALYAIQAQINRTPAIPQAMPLARTSTPVPQPRRPDRGGAPASTMPPVQLPATKQQLNSVIAPQATSPTGGTLTQAQMAAIRATPQPIVTAPTGGTLTQQQMAAIRATGAAPVAPGLITRPVQTTTIRPTSPAYDQRFLNSADGAIDYISLTRPGRTPTATPSPVVNPGLTAPGTNIPQQQLQAIRNVGTMPSTVRTYEAPTVASGAQRDPIGPGATYAGLQAFKNSGSMPTSVAGTGAGVYNASTTYQHSDGSSSPATTYTGSPTSKPTSPVTSFNIRSTDDNLNVEKAEKKTVMKPKTITTTVMVPNPAYGQVNPVAVGKLQSIHDREEARIMAAQQSKIPKMIPKLVTKTIMQPVEIVVRGGMPAPKVAPPQPQTSVEYFKSLGMSSSQAYAAANAASRDAARAAVGKDPIQYSTAPTNAHSDYGGTGAGSDHPYFSSGF